MVYIGTKRQPLVKRYVSCSLSVLGEILTEIKRAGKQAIAAARNTRVTMIGGLLGSDRKIWLISFSFPYLCGFSTVPMGTEGSIARSRSKIWLLNAVEGPNEPRRRVA